MVSAAAAAGMSERSARTWKRCAMGTPRYTRGGLLRRLKGIQRLDALLAYATCRANRGCPMCLL
jgi:hypothetical protein